MCFVQYLKSKVVAGEEQTGSDKPVTLSKKEKVPKDYLHLKVRGFSCQVKKKDIKEFFASIKLDSIRLPPKVKGVAYIGFSSEKEMKKALNKHRSFYGNNRFFRTIQRLQQTRLQLSIFLTAGHRISVVKSEKKVNLEEDPKIQKKKEAWVRQEDDMKKEETVAESGRIFIRNLAYTVTEEDIEALFSRYGPLAETHLPIDKHSRKIKVCFYFKCLKCLNIQIMSDVGLCVCNLRHSRTRCQSLYCSRWNCVSRSNVTFNCRQT